jgi:hypothetical protein
MQRLISNLQLVTRSRDHFAITLVFEETNNMLEINMLLEKKHIIMTESHFCYQININNINNVYDVGCFKLILSKIAKNIKINNCQMIPLYLC